MIPYLFKANQTTFDAGFIGTFDNALSCNVVETLNGAFELNMQILNDDPNLENMAIGSIIVAKPNQTYGNQPFIVEQLVKRIDGTISIYAVHMSQHRAKLIPVAPFTATSLADALGKIPTNSQESNPFTITTDKTVATGYTVDVPKTLRDIMGGKEGSLIDIYGGEWFYNNFDLMLLNRRGRTDSNLKVLYGTNMTDYVETDEFSWSMSYTGILPYYKDQDNLVIGDIQYGDHVNEYPYKKTVVYDFTDKFESVPTKSQLESVCLAFLNGKGVPHVSIEVSFEDLSTMPMYSQLNDNVEYIQLGDTVEIINSAYNTQFRSRVRTLDYDVLLERYNTIKIGDQSATINDVISDTASGDTINNTYDQTEVIKAGDVFKFSGNYAESGFISSSRKALIFTVHFAKPIKATSVTINNLKLRVRYGTGGYILQDVDVTTGYTLSATIIDEMGITITVTSSTNYQVGGVDVPNNCAVSVDIRANSQFTFS